MVYFFRPPMSKLAWRGMEYYLDPSSQRRLAAHMAHPLTHLGVSGISASRGTKAIDDVHDVIDAAGGPDWLTSHGVTLRGGIVVGGVVTLAGSTAMTVDIMLDGFTATDVARADRTAWEVSQLAAHQPVVSALLCVVGADEEPRSLPGPSGNMVTVTGLPWLGGLIRRILGGSPGPVGATESLLAAMESAGAKSRASNIVYVTLLKALHPAQWWIVGCIYLDDGLPFPLGTVVAGPGGAFVLEYESGDLAEVAEFAARNAARLRSYLPFADVMPVVVSDQASEAGDDPPPPAQAALVDHEHILPFISGARLRGLSRQQVAHLNEPCRGWWRRVTPGTAHERFGWTRPDS